MANMGPNYYLVEIGIVGSAIIYHTKNPRAEVSGDFFDLRQSEGYYDENFAQKRDYYLTSRGAK